MKNLRTVLYFVFLTLVASTFASCSDDNETIYGSLTINGQVTDDQGNPIANAVVTVYNTGEGEYATYAATDTDGSYSLLKFKCTESVYVSVVAEGFETDGISYKLQFSSAVPGITLGNAEITQNFTLQK